MKVAFRKISRVGSRTNGTTWYLSDDCLMAAKRFMYSVEYRRFYLRDLESVVIWPNRWWWLRLTIPAVVLAALGLAIWQWMNTTVGYILCSLGLLWMIVEVALGPTAKSRLRITGITVELPIVMRTRRAGSVLGKIDAALRVLRVNEQPITPVAATQSAESSVYGKSEASSTGSIAVATQTNAS